MNRRTLILGASAGAVLLVAGAAQAATAIVGQPAPDFTLSDTAGKPVRLADYRGRTVVLEWNNPGCPFVRKHYQGNMQALQQEAAAQGIVWLAINSTETGSGDYLSPAQLGRWMQDKKAAATATLMDEDGTAGKAYGARVTPHMYIVDAKGLLVYAGGIDSIRRPGWTTSRRPPTLCDRRWSRIKAGKPVSVPASPPYGCTVKYKT